MIYECWEAETFAGEYGWWSDASLGVRGYAHRISYEVLVGPVPDGLELDHLCRNKSCYNPLHLEPVTHQENSRRSGLHTRRAECHLGHPITYYSPIKRQKCSTCESRRQAAYRDRKRRSK